MRYAVIARHRGEFPVRLMCRMLQVSPAGFYASRTRPLAWHAVLDEVLLAHVRSRMRRVGRHTARPGSGRSCTRKDFRSAPSESRDSCARTASSRGGLRRLE